MFSLAPKHKRAPKPSHTLSPNWCQGLFLLEEICWRNRDVGGAQGQSVDQCVPLPAATVATVIGNDGQPAGKTGEAACWSGLGLRRRGVGVEEPGVCGRERERWREYRRREMYRWQNKGCDVEISGWSRAVVLLKKLRCYEESIEEMP